MKKSHALRLSAVILSIAVMLSFVTIPASAEETIGASFIEGTASTEIMTPGMTEKISAEIVLPERTVAPNDKVRLIVILEGDALLDNEEEVAAADSLGAFLASPKASNAKNTLDNIHDAAKADIENLVASSGSLDKPEFLYEYKTLLNGFAIETEYRFISDINALPNVKSVSVAKYYEAPAPIESDLPEDLGSIIMIGAPAYYAMEEFSDFVAPRALGAGSLIAIIDTGVQYTHIAFGSYDKNDFLDYGARDILDIQGIINSGNLNAFPAGSDFDFFSDMAAYLTTKGKIAFGYDYGCFDSNADPIGDEAANTHGTHVAGIAAGLVTEYDEVNEEELVLYSGIAPYAQLAAMKVADPMGRLYNYAIFAALEDCVTLGVDSINMSLGSNCGFTDPIDEYYDEIYDGDISFVEVYRKLTNVGITIANSAGNSATSLYEYNAGEIGYPNTENPDYGTIGSDSSYSDPLSVASVENFMYPVNVLYYNEDSFVAFSDNDEYPLSQSMTPDVPVDYAMCGLGKIADFYVGDTSVVTGKIAVIMRGEITFTEKIANAKAAGAIGVLICQNEINKGVPFGFLLSDLAPANALPCASADYDVFATLEKARPNGRLRYGTEYAFDEENGGIFSEFSSWGPTPDLRLKPEVAAPGGNIYSSVLYDVTDEDLSFEHKFALMSGTSMAAPQVAGAMAVVRSWVEAHIGAYNYTVFRPKAPVNGINNEIAPDFDDNFIKKTVKELGETVNNLLISTADPFAYIGEDIDDIPGENLIQGRFVSPRVQGAGLIDVENAVWSPVILSTPDIDGSGPDTTRPVLNLGEDMGNTGSFNLSFIATNLFYDEPITYDVVIYPMRPEVYESEDLSIYTGYDVLIEEPIEYGSITVKPGETKTVNVSYRLPRKARNLYKELYENGSYVEGYVRLIPVYEEEPIYSSPSLAAPQNGSIILEDYVGFDFNPEIENPYLYLYECYPVDLVVPFLGFYGEWEEAPIFDTDNYGEDGFDSRIYNTVIDAFGAYASGSAVYGGVNIGGDGLSYRLLGTNFWADYNNANYVADMNTKGWSSRDYIDYYNQLDYIAINPENPYAIVGIAGVNPALLRNVRNLNAKIFANGEVVYNENAEYCRKSFVDTDYMEYFNDAFWSYSFEREDGDYGFCEWYGTDRNGNILPNGTTATVTLTGYLDYFDFDMVKNDNNTWSFPVYIDRVAPEFDKNSFKVELIDGEIYARIKVSDDHMLATAALYEVDYVEGGEYIVDQEFYFDGETSDELVFNITEYYEKWYEGRNIVLYFYAEDYARNFVYTNDFIFNKIEASKYARTVEIEVGDDINLNKYDFESAFVSGSWSSRNSGIAKVTSRGILYGRGEGKTVVTGTLENGKVVTFTVIVTEPEIEIPDNVHDGFTVSTYRGLDLGTFINKSDPDIEWTVDKSYIATVSPSGYVTTYGYTGVVTVTVCFSDGSTEIFIINVVR